jgi:hypothetical protein
MGDAAERSGMLSDDLNKYCPTLPGFHTRFAGVIPPAWQ